MDDLTTAINAAFDQFKARHRLRSDAAMARQLGTNSEMIRRLRTGDHAPALRLVGPLLLSYRPAAKSRKTDPKTP